ncbi:MAG: imidazole glycerol phosphate synthase subunit HisH [Bacteroidota bacterium]
MKVSIIDYGAGNIYSLRAALRKIAPEVDTAYTSNLEELAASDKLILPGVGNFSLAMQRIEALGLRDFLRHQVLERGQAIMGICLGMQLLFEEGTEGGIHPGLGLLPGRVEAFPTGGTLKVPHVGFNGIRVEGDSQLYEGVEHRDFYFIHAYRVRTVGAEVAAIGWCDYGERFVASVEHQNIVGTQFHPEKSQTNGLKLLQNFLDRIPASVPQASAYV